MPQATFVLVSMNVEDEEEEMSFQLWGLLLGETPDGEWAVVDDGSETHAINRNDITQRWTGEWS